MNRKKFLNATFLVGVALFQLFFWQEKMGLNVLFFTAFVGLVLLYANPESFKEKPVLVTGFGTILLSLLVVFVNSALSKVMYSLSLISFAGFVHQQKLRFIGYSIMAKLLIFFFVPVALKKNFGGKLVSAEKAKSFLRYFKLCLIPLLLFIVFYIIYSFANPEFSKISQEYWNMLDKFFFSGPSIISLSRIIFIIFGAFILGMLILDPRRSFFTQREEKQQETLVRTKKEHRFPFSTIGLKSEYLMALLTFGSLNALLLLVNLLDIRNVWFNFKPFYTETVGEVYTSDSSFLSPYAMSQLVHEGTYLLIFSILLAMGVVLYFFRNNLNFFPNNKALKIIAYAWIAQNILLATSVGIRNFQYMKSYGLAYKRIGVVIFLILVIAGLVTMWLKVKDRKTGYFLFHRNGWIIYTVLILAAAVNWDMVITKHNLRQEPKQLDSYFLLNKMTDKNLHLLIEYGEEHKTKTGEDVFNYGIHSNRFGFLIKQSGYSFFSWNYPDHKNTRYLKANGLDNMNH